MNFDIHKGSCIHFFLNESTNFDIIDYNTL